MVIPGRGKEVRWDRGWGVGWCGGGVRVGVWEGGWRGGSYLYVKTTCVVRSPCSILQQKMTSPSFLYAYVIRMSTR